MKRFLPLGAAIVLFASPAAAQPAISESSGSARALVLDLEKIVESQESLGWTIDRYEYQAMLPDALVSVCRAPVPAREGAESLLDARVARLGGPIEAAFEKNGQKLDGLGALVSASRVRALLAQALEHAPADCPFWMKPDPKFRGVQTDADRVVVNLEGGGIFVLQRSRGHTTPGAGGSGRLLVGYGLDERFTVFVGAEFGGHALFEQKKSGLELPIQFSGAVPFVLRTHYVSWHHDVELAPIGFSTQDDARVSYGFRVGTLLGFSTLRIRRIMPWAGVGIAYETLFASAERPAFSMLKGGARLGFDWDF